MLDELISGNNPRSSVGAEKEYKLSRNGISYDATKLSPVEELIFLDWWNTFNTRYSLDRGPYQILNARHMEQALSDCEIMKKAFNGAKFAGGSPKEGEFGARFNIVEDLVGATDTEWGATTGGTAAWTAGQRNWLSQAAAQNSATYPANDQKLRNTTAGEEWGWTFFGVESFAAQPVVKEILMKIGGTDLAIENVEDKLRGSSNKIAVFDISKFVNATRTFQVGVEVGTSAQDQIAPIGVSWVTGSKHKNTTHYRPT